MDASITGLAAQDAIEVKALISNAMADYEEGKVITATNRRLENLFATYQGEGKIMLVAKIGSTIVGAAGVGPLHGLSRAEGIAEIRDLVVSKKHRRMGIGGKLLAACVDFTKGQGYQTIYLETTPAMSGAQRLFEGFGFRAVVEQKADKSESSQSSEEVPGYYILEDLRKSTT